MHFSGLILAALACMAPTLAKVYEVTVNDQGFQPSKLCLQPGDSVQWNFVAGGHSVEETDKADSCTSKGTWSSTTMMQGWQWNRTFRTPGVVWYMSSTGQDCARGFKGAIYVGGQCPATSSQASTPTPPPY
ncbi:hypothetical protein BGZ70_006150 [Mortierella alpina]|uniref:Uncharacterized protein n=1 Tax=Mortierella alpina TaxID=64518 RepID=A0A9P6M715_MORAP|nr:hypothetical protein BGZ70_006150 [Mortierella alpina]